MRKDAVPSIAVPTISVQLQGVDFFFSKRSHAQRFLDFLHGVVPLRYRTDKQLVSHNEQNATYNYKYTFSVEIVPICKVGSPKGCPSLPTCRPCLSCMSSFTSFVFYVLNWEVFCLYLRGATCVYAHLVANKTFPWLLSRCTEAVHSV